MELTGKAIKNKKTQYFCRLYELLTLAEGSYYNDNAFFRVVPDFVAQFGINGDPTISAEWEDNTIPDDPVVISNLQV